MFGARAVRLPARHHHLRQGHDLGLLAARRDDRLRPDRRAVPARAPTASRTATPSAATRSSAAVALANLDIFEREGLNRHVLRQRGRRSAPTLEKLLDLPIVGDVRGDGYFFGIELVKDKATKETFNDEESERLLRGFLSKALFDAGPLLPRRRPRRPGHPARAAADLRPGALRRDRADPALGARGGLDQALSPTARRGVTGSRVLPRVACSSDPRRWVATPVRTSRRR